MWACLGQRRPQVLPNWEGVGRVLVAQAGLADKQPWVVPSWPPEPGCLGGSHPPEYTLKDVGCYGLMVQQCKGIGSIWRQEAARCLGVTQAHPMSPSPCRSRGWTGWCWTSATTAAASSPLVSRLPACQCSWLHCRGCQPVVSPHALLAPCFGHYHGLCHLRCAIFHSCSPGCLPPKQLSPGLFPAIAMGAFHGSKPAAPIDALLTLVSVLHSPQSPVLDPGQPAAP